MKNMEICLFMKTFKADLLEYFHSKVDLSTENTNNHNYPALACKFKTIFAFHTVAKLVDA